MGTHGRRKSTSITGRIQIAIKTKIQEREEGFEYG
jgi:hypothetical protein